MISLCPLNLSSVLQNWIEKTKKFTLACVDHSITTTTTTSCQRTNCIRGALRATNVQYPTGDQSRQVNAFSIRRVPTYPLMACPRSIRHLFSLITNKEHAALMYSAPFVIGWPQYKCIVKKCCNKNHCITYSTCCTRNVQYA